MQHSFFTKAFLSDTGMSKQPPNEALESKSPTVSRKADSRATPHSWMRDGLRLAAERQVIWAEHVKTWFKQEKGTKI